MSYADLKPVKFEEYANGLPDSSYQNDPYYQPYPVATEILEYTQPYQLQMDQHSIHHPEQPQSQLHYFISHENEVCGAPVPAPAPAPVPASTPAPATVIFRKPNGSPTKRRSERVDRDITSSSEISEELQNHWMPMTWIERSSDDPQVFNFVCLWDQCVSVSSSKDEFVQHLYSHVSTLESHIELRQADKIVCKVRGCGKHLEAIADLGRHMSMHIFQADCQQKGSETLIEKEEYSEIESCGFDPCTNINYDGEELVCMWESCGQPFTSLTDLFDHVGQHIDSVSDIDRIEHDGNKGDKKNVYLCKWTGCTTVSDSKSNLRRHARHHSGEKVLACPFCARFFSRRDKLYDHCVRRTILMNDSEDPFLCKLCHKRFGTEKALCMHVSRHLAGHTCGLCGLAAGSRADIHRHLMLKHSRRSKDFKCDVCSKWFFTESELSRHAVFHSDVMYSCKHCDEKFKWKKQLLKHMKEHEEGQNFNPTPYMCHICERSYTTGFALGRHLTKQHRLDVPYGFSRFTYKKCADGLMRLQTKKLLRGESTEEHHTLPYNHNY
ncbi:unnamed protein product [Caenorhabditis sp. 36 PRJEB53466]|nr:unnamed protein product [Caenorhabditis sp. 36 PRJEB53466]